MSRDRLDIKHVHKFARGARAYTCAYCHFAYGDDENNVGEKQSPASIE